MVVWSLVTGIVKRAPAYLTFRHQPLARHRRARYSTVARKPALVKSCLAEDVPSRPQVSWNPTSWWVIGSGGSRLPDDSTLYRAAGYGRGVSPETVRELCDQGRVIEGVEALGVLVQTDGRVSRSLFYAVLKKCVVQKDLVLGRRLHAFTVEKGYESDTFLGNHILRMYAAHGRLQDAMDVLAVVGNPDAFTWSAIISAHVKDGQDRQAVELYHRMRRSAGKPDGHVFVTALQACAMGSDLETGKQVHADVLASGVEPDVFVCSGLVDMYAKCGSLGDARSVFDGLGKKNVVTWNAMLGGYSQHGQGQEALSLYRVMQDEGIVAPDAVTFVCLLQACGSAGTLALEKGKELHAHIREQGQQFDVSVCNSLVNMYAKCGDLEDALEVFDGLRQKDVVTWNSMISGYSQQGMVHKAFLLYRSMQNDGVVIPNTVTFSCLLQACATAGSPALEKGKELHAQIRDRGHEAVLTVANSLVTMYAKCGSLEDARRVFDELGHKNVVTWNAMIAGYSQHAMGHEALLLYKAMQDGIIAPDSVTFVSLLQACASMGHSAVESGKELHAQLKEGGHQTDVFVANSLVNMYAKCGSLEDAQVVFNGLSQKDVVTWNTMIAGYSQQAMGREALCLYDRMEDEGGASPDPVTFAHLLQACVVLGIPGLKRGKEIHEQIEHRGHRLDAFLASRLVNMYSKCGSLEEARTVFNGLCQKDVLTWNAMIAGYAQQGVGQEVLRLYSLMQEDGTSLPNSATFVSLLQACASMGTTALEEGRHLHAQICDGCHQADTFIASGLVNMYAKCGSLEDAEAVFNGLHQKEVATWTSLIAGYSQQGMGREALHLYTLMQEEGMVEPDSVTFVCLLQACASVGSPALEKGTQLHVQIRERGHEADKFVANSLVNMYAKCGSLEAARRVFDRLGQKDVLTWNTMIAGYSQQGMGQESLHLYSLMQERGTAAANSVTFVCLLQACASLRGPGLDEGKWLHAQIREGGHEADVSVANSLVHMYAKCGSLEDAQRVFDGLGAKDVVTWTALMAGYSQHGWAEKTLSLYIAMQEEGLAIPNSLTFVSLLQACASMGRPALEEGRKLHADVKQRGHESDLFVANSLINMYAKCGSLEDAQRVFDGAGKKDTVTWNVFIVAYAEQGKSQEALNLYSAMQEEGTSQPSSVTFVCLLQLCARAGISALERGKHLHEKIRELGLEADALVANSLVDMYAKCGSLKESDRVFYELGQKDVVTWTALIAGYCQRGMSQDALRLYGAMQDEGIAAPNSVTFVCLLVACAAEGSPALEMGKQLHAQIRERGYEADMFVASSLVNMYAKCGSMEDAQRVFDRLVVKDVVAWTALIAGYSQQGMGEEALHLYNAMQESGMAVPNSVTFVCLLRACAKVAALHVGRRLHAQIEEQGLQADAFVASSLINMYGKAGSLVDAQQLFDAVVERDVVTWNALIAGYACQGDSEAVFNLVQRMEDDGVQPIGITFLSVVTSCSHAGLVDKGKEYFQTMSCHHGITPTVEHYTCMVDLLGRAGHLDEAVGMIRTMPVLPTAAVWHALLGACHKWSNAELGHHAFLQAVKLDKRDAAAYVAMSNIYNNAQMWEQAEKMQAARVRTGAWKYPGQSCWTDMDGHVHSFLVRDEKYF